MFIVYFNFKLFYLSIASAFKITVRDLLTCNPNLNCQFLPVGQQISILSANQFNPVTPVQSTCSNYYTLFSGDSCDSIAAAYKTTVITILALNPTLNCLNLPIGSLICVPGFDPTATINPVLGCSSFYTVFGGDTCDS